MNLNAPSGLWIPYIIQEKTGFLLNKPVGRGRWAVNTIKAKEITYVLQAVMAWQVSPVQNSEMVLYCRLIRLKNVVAVVRVAEKRVVVTKNMFSCSKTCTENTHNTSASKHALCGSGPLTVQCNALHLSLWCVWHSHMHNKVPSHFILQVNWVIVGAEKHQNRYFHYEQTRNAACCVHGEHKQEICLACVCVCLCVCTGKHYGSGTFLNCLSYFGNS